MPRLSRASPAHSAPSPAADSLPLVQGASCLPAWPWLPGPACPRALCTCQHPLRSGRHSHCSPSRATAAVDSGSTPWLSDTCPKASPQAHHVCSWQKPGSTVSTPTQGGGEQDRRVTKSPSQPLPCPHPWKGSHGLQHRV